MGIAMWSFLAHRYREVDNIAGFEVMSEPRVENVDGCVHEFHRDACAAVWAQDPSFVCFIGPAKFYDRDHLNEDYVLVGGPVIYAANFFVPKKWVTNETSVRYGDTVGCCEI